MTAYPAASYLALEMFDEARTCAEASLREHASANARDRSPSREAIAQLDLTHALAGLGDPEACTRLVADALASSRVVGSVITRANQLAEFMVGRYPDHAETNALLAQVARQSRGLT